jgi:hypothetical protein
MKYLLSLLALIAFSAQSQTDSVSAKVAPYKMIIGDFKVSVSGEKNGEGTATIKIIPNGQAVKHSCTLSLSDETLHFDFYYTLDTGLPDYKNFIMTFRCLEWNMQNNFIGHFADGPIEFQSYNDRTVKIRGIEYSIRVWIAYYEKDKFNMGIELSTDEGKTWSEIKMHFDRVTN